MNEHFIDAANIGHSIKALRQMAAMSQERLAELSGYSVRNLRRLENDDTNSIATINLFASIFQVSAFDILNGCFLFMRLLLRQILTFHLSA